MGLRHRHPVARDELIGVVEGQPRPRGERSPQALRRHRGRRILRPHAPDKQPRPKMLHVIFDDGQASTDLALKDELKAQTKELKGAKGVTKVTLEIAEVFPGQGGADTSIAEVEFRTKS